MAKKVTIVKRKGPGENSAMDRRFDKAHPGLKEGSPREEAFDRQMAKRVRRRKR
jgi:hypothetical protein